MYRNIECSIWQDPKIRAFAVEQKLIWVYLITSDHSHVSGIYRLPLYHIQHELGIPLEKIEMALALFSKVDLAQWDPENEVVWVKNMLSYQGKGEKIYRSAANHLKSLHGSFLVGAFLMVNPEVGKFTVEKVRRRKGIPTNRRFKIFERDKFRCHYCGKGAAEATLEVDHIIPVSKGGTDADSNLVTACWDCNHGKADTLSEIPDTPSEIPDGVSLRSDQIRSDQEQNQTKTTDRCAAAFSVWVGHKNLIQHKTLSKKMKSTFNARIKDGYKPKDIHTAFDRYSVMKETGVAPGYGDWGFAELLNRDGGGWIDKLNDPHFTGFTGGAGPKQTESERAAEIDEIQRTLK